MDWSFYVEAAWRASVPLELVPDLTAWLACSATALSLAYFLLIRRPQTCAVGAIAWLSWLAWQVCFVTGYEAFEEAKRRGRAALDTTDRFSQALLDLIRVWTNLFLPFLHDVARWLGHLWKQLSLRTRLFLIACVLTAYAIVEVYRMFRRRKRLVGRVLFHASFLIGGPLLWQVLGVLPCEWLRWCLDHVVTTVPTLLSLQVLSWDAALKKQQGVSAAPTEDASGNGSSSSAIVMQRSKLWLSYWVCWPVMGALQAAVVRAPRLLPYFALQSHLQADLLRGLLIFLVWLQFWQGSRLLNFTLHGLLRQTKLFDVLASIFGAGGVQALQVARGSLAAAVPIAAHGERLIRRLAKRFWLVVFACVVGAISAVLLVYLFYGAVSMVSSLATVLLWFFAAADSADILATRAEGFYIRKLSFWVLAMLWEFSSHLPYIGVLLRLFRPAAFALFLVAGETLFGRLALPALTAVAKPACAVNARLCACLEERWAQLRAGMALDAEGEVALPPDGAEGSDAGSDLFGCGSAAAEGEEPGAVDSPEQGEEGEPPNQLEEVEQIQHSVAASPLRHVSSQGDTGGAGDECEGSDSEPSGQMDVTSSAALRGDAGTTESPPPPQFPAGAPRTATSSGVGRAVAHGAGTGGSSDAVSPTSAAGLAVATMEAAWEAERNGCEEEEGRGDTLAEQLVAPAEQGVGTTERQGSTGEPLHLKAALATPCAYKDDALANAPNEEVDKEEEVHAPTVAPDALAEDGVACADTAVRGIQAEEAPASRGLSRDKAEEPTSPGRSRDKAVGKKRGKKNRQGR